MSFEDKKIESVGALVDTLKEYSKSWKIIWFRGQVNANWNLIPSIARNESHLRAESTAIKLFKQNARPYLHERPETEWEWIFLMQHHRAPTRLLDWSESPLVALYFALYDPKRDNEDNDAALWLLDPVALNHHSGHRHSFDKEILAFGIDNTLDQYLPDQVNARRTDLYPVAAIGPRNSPRMVAQAGTFTIMHANPISVDEIGDKKHIRRMIIPSTSKDSLRTELSLLGVNEFSLFPDLDRVADVARGLLV